jgi:hypothetical protein
MPDTRYDIEYLVKPDKAITGIDRLEARLLKLEPVLRRIDLMFKGLGGSTPGLLKIDRQIQTTLAALLKLTTTAGTTGAGLTKVGTGNTAINAYDQKVAKLEADLHKLTTAANNAAAATAGVGAGGGPGGVGGGAGRGGGGAAGGGRGMGQFVNRTAMGIAVGTAYSVFRKAAGAAGQGAADRNEFFTNAADVSSEYAKDLQEVAVLQGKTSADDDVVRQNLKFAKDTGMDPETARQFRLEFGGAVEASIDAGGMSRETADKLEVEAGKFTARYGLDPQTGGRMAGLLGVTSKVPDVQTGMGIMAEAIEALNIKGVGSVKQLAGQMTRLSGNMLNAEEGGRFKSYREQAAFYSATTVAEGGNAAVTKTKVSQSDDFFLTSQGNENGKAFLDKLGIRPDQDLPTQLRLLEPAVRGPGGQQKLFDAGFHETTRIKSIIKATKALKLYDATLADPRLARARTEAIARNNEYMGSGAGRQQVAENMEFEATVEAGMEGRTLKRAMTEARAGMINRGDLKSRGVFESLTRGYRSLAGSYGGVSGEEMEVKAEAVMQLRLQGQKVGVDIDKQYPGLATNYVGLDNSIRVGSDAGIDQGKFQKDFASASAKIDAAGKLITAAGRQMNQGPGGPPAPGNGGAGVNPGRR